MQYDQKPGIRPQRVDFVSTFGTAFGATNSVRGAQAENAAVFPPINSIAVQAQTGASVELAEFVSW